MIYLYFLWQNSQLYLRLGCFIHCIRKIFHQKLIESMLQVAIWHHFITFVGKKMKFQILGIKLKQISNVTEPERFFLSLNLRTHARSFLWSPYGMVGFSREGRRRRRRRRRDIWWWCGVRVGIGGFWRCLRYTYRSHRLRERWSCRRRTDLWTLSSGPRKLPRPSGTSCSSASRVTTITTSSIGSSSPSLFKPAIPLAPAPVHTDKLTLCVGFFLKMWIINNWSD